MSLPPRAEADAGRPAAPATGVPALVAAGHALVGERRLQIDVTVAAGEVVGIIGPNGAGKSLTIEAIVGLRRLAGGTITVGGTLVDGGTGSHVVPPQDRMVAWVPQSPGLLPRRRVLDQVAPFSRAGVDGARRALQAVAIDHLADVRPRALSGGQRQRVAVARALANAGLVAADEPTSAQDAEGTLAVLNALRAHATTGGAALVVTHDPAIAHLVADRLVVVEDLGVTQSGRPFDLAARPATEWISANAGATVVTGMVDADHVLHAAHGTLVVSDRVPVGPARAAVAPTSVVLHRTRPTDGSARNVLSGEVVALHEAPDGLRVHVSTTPDLVATLTRAAVAELGLEPGVGCWASVKASEIQVRPEGGYGHGP